MMARIPYGYRIVDGKAVADEEQAEIIRKIFDGYIEGLALTACAKRVGLNMKHCSVGKILRNTHYIGDEYYPSIIDRERFEKAEKIRMTRAKALGKIRELKKPQIPVADTRFRLRRVEKKFTDPFAQAEYVYSLIESEVSENG